MKIVSLIRNLFIDPSIAIRKSNRKVVEYKISKMYSLGFKSVFIDNIGIGWYEADKLQKKYEPFAKEISITDNGVAIIFK